MFQGNSLVPVLSSDYDKGKNEALIFKKQSKFTARDKKTAAVVGIAGGVIGTF